jgi:hypothetical protein
MSSDREYQELVQAFRSVDSQIEEAEKLLESTSARIARIRNLKQQRNLLAERGLSGRRSKTLEEGDRVYVGRINFGKKKVSPKDRKDVYET